MEGAWLRVAALLVTSSLVTVVTSSVIVFHVSEELSSGTLVGNVKTSSNISQQVNEEDMDRLQFHILSSDGLRITSIFSINSKTGAIFTNAMIDREQVCDRNPVCELEFDVTVKIDSNFLKLLTVRVIVDDVNDNAPTFPKGEINLTVSESAPVNSEIPISGALDRDAGINTTISYSLQVSSVFGLKEVRQLDGSSALRLVVQQSLDREAVSSYSFLILAADGSGPQALTGTLAVSVLVSDVNDNEPKFSKNNFQLTVMETAPVGTVFGHLTASDGDVGNNGKLSFRFSPLTNKEVTDLFSLNSTSGELSVAGALLYKSDLTFQCVVEVMDLGVPPQVSQANLRIYVADAGNTPPKLDLILAEPVFGDQSAMLPEDVQVGTFVGTLKAEDLDKGLEGQVSCSSLDSHFFLQDLDTMRYGIVVNQTLDREEQQEMTIVLLCSDSGDPPLTASTSFKVIVRDVNDNAPEFSQAVYRAWLTENGSGLQDVTQVVATDRDDSTNSVVSYSLDPQSALLFSIDSLTGRITTLRTFDREASPSVTLTVYASDSGTPTLTGSASVSVSIADVNDNAPYVNRSDYYVSENLPVGRVFNISLLDQDEGENGTVVVSAPRAVDLDPVPFTVLPNGSLRVQWALDRERQSTYIIPVTLRDLGSPPLSSTATLTVHLVDTNDHTPFFLFPAPPNDTVTVRAGIPVGSPVCQIRAEDGDMGLNGVITYSIIDGNSGRWLAINNLTGDIFTIRSLADMAGSTLRLRVAASDLGMPPLVTQALLDVYLKTNRSSLHLGQNNSDDRYVIIAGVIAGITFIIAVVVIAVIVHMRNSDLRRQTAMRRAKGDEEQRTEGKMHKLSVLCPNGGVVLTDPGKSGHIVTTVDGPQGLSVERGGFDSLGVSTRQGNNAGGCGDDVDKDMLDLPCHLPFAGIQEGQNRLVSEDHNSDTSGESIACDSGRGASDEEIVYPVTGKTAGSSDPPPRIPPRRPLSTIPQWSRDSHVVSTNWSLADSPRYLAEEDPARFPSGHEGQTDEASFLGGDFQWRSRKGPLRVRFSFDEGDSRSQGSVLSGRGLDNEAYPGPQNESSRAAVYAGPDPRGQLYSDLCANRVVDASASPTGSQSTPGHFSVRDLYTPDKNLFPSRHSERDGDRYRKDLRLNPESKYPRLDRFPRKQGARSCPSAWDGQAGKARNSESLSSLAQSVDDDGSTTTSGSYSIESEDAVNVSLEC